MFSWIYFHIYLRAPIITFVGSLYYLISKYPHDFICKGFKKYYFQSKKIGNSIFLWAVVHKTIVVFERNIPWSLQIHHYKMHTFVLKKKLPAFKINCCLLNNSDYKVRYDENCDDCAVKNICGGIFVSTKQMAKINTLNNESFTYT